MSKRNINEITTTTTTMKKQSEKAKNLWHKRQSLTTPPDKIDIQELVNVYICPTQTNLFHNPELACEETQRTLEIDDILTKVTSDLTVCRLMRTVPQNADKETVDYKESFSLEKVFDKDSISNGEDIRNTIRGPRMLINSLFKRIMYVNPLIISPRWWFENHTRLDKLLFVALSLESINLSTFDGNPTPTIEDIPQQLAITACVLKMVREDFENIKATHKTVCTQYIPEYAGIYTKSK